nr:MAG TPA: hypothetical protein [Caudoviricetes sp.]
MHIVYSFYFYCGVYSALLITIPLNIGKVFGCSQNLYDMAIF